MVQWFTSLLKLTRTGNLLIIVVAQLFTARFIGYWGEISLIQFLLLVTGTLLIAAAGYIINDYYDIKIDYINKPDQVVIGRSISRRVAIFTHVILNTLGIIAGLLISVQIGLINAFCVFLLWLYSNQLKRLPFWGNLSVAILTGISIEIVGLLVTHHNPLITIYAVFAFFMTLIREIIKDMEDVQGDIRFGCRTLPIAYGIRKTKIFLYLITALFAITVVVLLRFLSTGLIFYYFVFLAPAIVALVYFIRRADTKKDFTRLSLWSKLIMILGIISMLFYRV